ncbi:MAG: DDE-type integrase/transposase/recombinase [Deltaproteobacteria bacterium]|nr:DDE-type integrase/transposase/recombinase [Deltaproteobacteria bacterium]
MTTPNTFQDTVHEELRQRVAVFRYGVIAEIAQQPPGTPGLHAMMVEKAQREYEIPGTKRQRIATETIRGWVRDYRRGGFEALKPRPRADIGSSRSIPATVVDLLCETKEEQPKLSIPLLIKAVRDEHADEVPADLALPHSTVHRLLARRGLMQKSSDEATTKDRRRFAFRDAGDLWMCDVMHGPRVTHEGRKQKAYLIAFLDDATRVIPHAEFKASEGVAAFLPVFEQAILKRGLPRRLYVDNGSAFRSHQLQVACAKLNIVLIHARPYSPQGKGKMERWFRTVRLQLLPTLQPEDLRSLDTLNRRLAGWVEGEYHRAPHRGLENETPLTRWASTAQGVRMAPPNAAECFRIDAKRKVARDRTVTLDGVAYEVDAALIGNSVTLRFDASRKPKDRTVEVLHQGKHVQHVRPLDTYANCFVKRHNSLGENIVEGPAPEPVPPGLSLRALEDDEDDRLF